MTGAGNHVIPNVHFKKWWQKYTKTWFNQPARKKKAAAIAPRPTAGMLRPAVHPPTQRYNTKLRLGRGFTLDELKEAKIPKKLAKTIGIAVDHRRRNACTESLQLNAQRLKLYMSKLMIFPKGSGRKSVKKGDTARSELQNVAQNTLKEIIPIPKPTLRIKARKITSEEQEKSAYKTLLKARTDKKYEGAKRKKAAEAKEE